MAITTTTPTVLEVGSTFDALWATNVTIEGTNPRKPVRCRASLRKSRLRQDGNYQFSPIDAPVTIDISDLFGEAAARAAAGKPALATAVQAVLAALQELANEQE
jgi:hypothetical protein